MSEFNRLFSNEFADDDLNNNKLGDFKTSDDENKLNTSITSPIKEQHALISSEMSAKPKFKGHLDILNHNSSSHRTSTPRANKIKTRKSSCNDEDDDEEDDFHNELSIEIGKQPISDDSLVIALSQFESKEQKQKPLDIKITAPPPLPPQNVKPAPSVAVKKFNFVSNNNTKPKNNDLNEKSFTRFKSDPLNNSSLKANERKRLNSNNYENVKNRINIYSSSQTNAMNNANNNNNVVDDDDDEMNLLFNDQNLLKIIDSKVDAKSIASIKPSTTNNNHLNDTFNRNLVVKKTSSSHLQPLTTNKVIQVPQANKCNLKMPRMSSSDQVTANSAAQNSRPSIANKNFYGTTAPTLTNTANKTSQGTIVKYTEEQIEFKRQQALLRLQKNKK